jgi:hypothetical protein
MKRIPESKWKWFGNVGHFVCGQWCRFHLTTQVGKYLVSTIGEYVHPMHSGGSERTETEYLLKKPLGENVGLNRKFETIVFKAGKPCQSKSCGCGLPKIGEELNSRGYNDRKAATDGHRRLCKEYASK